MELRAATCISDGLGLTEPEASGTWLAGPRPHPAQRTPCRAGGHDEGLLREEPWQVGPAGKGTSGWSGPGPGKREQRVFLALLLLLLLFCASPYPHETDAE